MDSRHDTAIEAVLEQLIEHGPEGIATVFARTFEMGEDAPATTPASRWISDFGSSIMPQENFPLLRL